MTYEEIFKQGFMAGFAISAEGWNAEYPFCFGEKTDFTKDEFVLKKLQQAIKKTHAERQELTDGEILNMYLKQTNGNKDLDILEFARAILRKAQEK